VLKAAEGPLGPCPAENISQWILKSFRLIRLEQDRPLSRQDNALEVDVQFPVDLLPVQFHRRNRIVATRFEEGHVELAMGRIDLSANRHILLSLPASVWIILADRLCGWLGQALIGCATVAGTVATSRPR
jgi:hypothetical protein